MTFYRFTRAGALAIVLSLATTALTSGAHAQAPAANLPDITVLTIVDVTPDYALANNVAHAKALLNKLKADTRQAPGLTSFKVLQDPARDNHFVITSTWKDMKSFDLYTGAETTRAFRTAFQPGEAGPFDERIYVDLN